MSSSQTGSGSGGRSEPAVPELDASRFEMLESVGSGGMGTVYRAVQRSVGRHVAVKVLAPEHAANAMGLQRFVREANIIARLTHPNIVQLIDFGRDREGRLLLVMELLEGEPLRALLRREGRLAPERAVYAAVQTLNALRVAHAAGVVHRDLKPENVFIHRSGDDDHVKVLDFGVAKLTQGDTSDVNTTQGSLVGTLRYMAPEQIAGEAPDHRIDVYAVGMLLYEMLAAAMPYDTRDRYVLLRQIIAEEPAHLLSKAPDVSPALAEAVMRAIQKSPRDRFQSVDEFRKALTPFLAGDHARLQALADASNRGPVGGAGALGGEIRSGIVRSGHVQLAASAMGVAGFAQPQFVAPSQGHPSSQGYPSSQGHPSSQGYMSAPGYAPAPVLYGIAPQPTPASSSRPIVWALVAALVLVVLGGGVALSMRTGASSDAQAPSPGAAPPAPSPVAPTAPPAPATRMVTVTTTPPGAQVLDAAGATLCAATPCAIPVPVSGPLAIRIVREGVSLGASLDPNSPSASIDLTGLSAPAQPVANNAVDAGARRVERRRTPANHAPAGSAQGGDELPMFLPH
jgi:serine/threonine protein kinase